MPQETLAGLAIKPNGCYLDGTFGRGGHSRLILEQLNAEGRLLAIDRDPEAINSEAARKLQEDSRFTLIHSPFSRLLATVEQQDLTVELDGIVLDLGVSSPQLDTPNRGFSFLSDGLLDMRMDNSTGSSAADWLAKVEEKDLADILFSYGEERFSRRIARAIIKHRQISPITTTGQLAQVIAQATPRHDPHKHPATRSFQAIRIAINNELEELKTALAQAILALNLKGRLVVISFHSLEDRIVKRFFRDE